MKKLLSISLACIGLLAVWFTWNHHRQDEAADQLHYERNETELVVSNLSNAAVQLFGAGNALESATLVSGFDGSSIWLHPGNYFLNITHNGRSFFLPAPMIGYRAGPDEEGSFIISIRPAPKEFPPRLFNSSSAFLFIPGGNFLLGDRQNPRETHYVWLTGYFVYPFEITNAEFRAFLNDPEGYGNSANWCVNGKRWKSLNASRTTAKLKSTDTEYSRFGQDDQPVTWVNWFEANAYCRWATNKVGKARWLYSLPNDAEWEKAARGPDNFDYALGMTISDDEVDLYNWKKNSDALVTVTGIEQTKKIFTPNRYGLYNITGNVAEWTQSLNIPYNRDHPYVDDERNHDETPGLRSVRGGSWYSAAISYLYIPYRDAFHPEQSSQELGFRVVVKALP